MPPGRIIIDNAGRQLTGDGRYMRRFDSSVRARAFLSLDADGPRDIDERSFAAPRSRTDITTFGERSSE